MIWALALALVASPVLAAPVNSVRGGVDLWKAGDYAGAVAMWQPFANGGDADAMFNIGQAYKLGRAVPKDTAQALSFYRRAAMKGHLPAQANLGIMLFQAGEKTEALRWLKAAADKNEMRAQYVLGVAHWNGDGLARSLTLAYAYLSRASALGLPEATTALGNLTPMVSPLERANGWAVSSSLAAGNGVPAAFAKGTPPAVLASAERYSPEQVIKPVPRAAEAPAPVRAAPAPVSPAPVVVAAAAPRPAPVAVAPAVVPRPAPVVAQAEVAPAGVPEKTGVRALAPSVAPVVTSVAIPASAPPSPVAIVQAAVPKPVPIAVAPKEVVVAAAPKVVAPRPSGWRVQLGAFAKRGQAEAAWSEMQAKQAAVVAKSRPIYELAGSVTKLQLGPFASKAAARDTCAKIAFSGRACFVTEG